MSTPLESRQVSTKRSRSVHPLKRLLDYGHNYRKQIWLATACSILNKLFDLAPPALIGVAVDVVVKQQDSIIAQWGVKDVFGQFLILSVLTVIIWILESVFEYAFARLWRNLGQNIQHDLRLDAYKHLQDLELAYFEERSTGGLMSILSDDINQLERFLDVGANDILQVLTTVVIIGGAFFVLAPSVAWMSMLPIPFILWGSFAYQNLLAPRYAEVRERVGLLNARLANNLGGITTIKSFTSEDYEVSRLAQESEAYRRSNSKAIKLSAAFVPLIRMLILVGFTALLLFGGMAAVNGKMSVGTYSVLVFLIQRLLWPLTRLGETFDQYQRAMASTNRVMNLLDTPIAIPTGNISLPLDAVRGEVEFQHITFAYQDRTPVVQNLSLHIPAGKTIAIVGSTGSGKSTLVKLLLRFYEVSSGNITLDGIDIQTLKLRDLRRCIGLVSQDVFLFHGTVAENIAYGSLDATDHEIITAAKIAEAHEFITQLPQGYETIVGERGQKLSGGQRQRIAIARAVLKNPPILILDEATSAVDNETEAAIQRSLERITVNRTTIAIAHRLSTIRNADTIYVMEYGKLVESGTHEQLLEENGIYASLWRVQSGLK
ncbi:ABC transporter ATP-binding protein/permease [Aetokthonos hydrillicola Thurmond2011]|uniref:ABC transporter ATP-binding protein/permease n=2 Tax=Aetokthonos TaxID=1550243 RepID=A0AAP5I305_9CYAN|nr:ABC transporter ATP-binding protein [Aetokthonos hydrillicola]MBO3458359.1 ABC transporter ATP-binding protein [Aetokthonos hydrillicola CCALA 1050]MBW4585924.1 ABC transporter ATP-binding protein/permease [Aetokthonos hydrillicola CCALA 1050]MDR9893849.1 ABC transporter ATP-binding protein/permease [Aetokthonos hydrillicola Thurmond2011]